MGSATHRALEVSAAALAEIEGVTLAVAAELFAVARSVNGSVQLTRALADAASAPTARTKVVTDVFGSSVQPATIEVLTAVVTQRWSTPSDLIDGLEDIAVRATAVAAGDDDLASELFSFERTIAAHPDLELALGSRLGDPAAKGDLVSSLLSGKASEATVLIVSSLVQQPRDRRVRQLLDWAIDIVSAQRGRTIATVASATELTEEQSARLVTILTSRYGSAVSVNTVIDPSLVGGVRIQIADDVIDMTVARRLADVRQQLVGS